MEKRTFFALPKIFHYGVKFDISSILAFIPAYVVSLIGTVGIMMAIGEASNQKISSERAKKWCSCRWCWFLDCRCFGAGPNTAFSQNVGLITLTKVASRHVMILAGIILTLLGVFPKLSALISIMPQPVLGGVGIIMFGLVASRD